MARNVNRALWEQWRQRIARQRGGKLSIAEFCRKEGVSQASFHAWKRKLHESQSAPPSSRRSAPVRPRTAGEPGDIRRERETRHSLMAAATTTRPADFLQVPVLGARTAPWIELVLIDGTIIRVPQQNLAALHTVLQVLRGGRFEELVGEVSHA